MDHPEYITEHPYKIPSTPSNIISAIIPNTTWYFTKLQANIMLND